MCLLDIFYSPHTKKVPKTSANLEQKTSTTYLYTHYLYEIENYPYLGSDLWMWGTWRTRSFQFQICRNITNANTSQFTACLLQWRWHASTASCRRVRTITTVSCRRVRPMTTWMGSWAIKLVRWLIIGRMTGLSICHVRGACIGDCSRSLTTEKGLCLQLRMHGYRNRGYGKWYWVGIGWRWPNDYRRLHSSPWV